ncbi:MAG: response regulator [Deltaproteobacteria bacterium]|nr:response regulator [Deltaproteobacteria bacterium]
MGITVKKPKILIVDDEPVIRDILTEFLTLEGYEIETAQDGLEAREKILSGKYNVILSDLKMPNLDGMQLLQFINDRRIQVVPIIMTGYGTIETAIDAMKAGAYDYILKPFKMEDIIRVLDRAIERYNLIAENIQLREALSLYHMSEEMSSKNTPEGIFELIINAISEALSPDVIEIYEVQKNKSLRIIKRKNLTQEDNIPKLDPERLRFIAASSSTTLLEEGDYPEGLFVENAPASALFAPIKVNGENYSLLAIYKLSSNQPFTEGQRKTVLTIADRAGAHIENIQLVIRMQNTFSETIQGFAMAIEAKDRYTIGHSERVAKITLEICKGLGLSEEETGRIFQAALLHDIGKIGIRYEELNKPEKLTPKEYEMFKLHPVIGKKILQPITFLQNILPDIYHHHEQYDGSGYPDGLRGEEIPLGARILAIADTYDAMTSDRPYRPALSHDVAIEELKRCSGTQFDPKLVEVFIKIYDHKKVK